MAVAAGRAIDRGRAAVPEDLDRRIGDLALFAPRQASGRDSRTDTGPYRRAVRDRRILEILYADFAGLRSERRVRPLGLLFYGSKWLPAAWFAFRRDFPRFRLDRLARAPVTCERLPRTHTRPE